MIPPNCLKFYCDIQDAFVANLIRHMEERKLTIAELARQIDLGETTIGHWLNRHSVPTLAAAALLAERFGVTIDSLIRKE